MALHPCHRFLLIFTHEVVFPVAILLDVIFTFDCTTDLQFFIPFCISGVSEEVITKGNVSLRMRRTYSECMDMMCPLLTMRSFQEIEQGLDVHLMMRSRRNIEIDLILGLHLPIDVLEFF